MSQKYYVFIGTYTQPIRFGTGQILEGKGEGIYAYQLDTSDGALELVQKNAGIVNPSYLTLDANRQYLYCVNELKEYEGKASGAVSAYSVETGTLALKFINIQPTGGTDPCHVVVNDDNTHAYISNFMSGSVAVFPILPGGALGECSEFIQHAGSSVNKQRQSGPHAHSLIFDRDNKFAFVPDLGIDKVVAYRTDFVNGKLIYNDSDFACAPGAGPRHCVFHPALDYCYLINELECSISALRYDGQAGGFALIHTISTMMEPFDGHNSCADIHISPDGRFVYGSNRGHNSIAIYRVDQNTGELAYVATQPSFGSIPRNFGIDPTGSFMLVCNQDTDNVVVLAIDKDTGIPEKLSETRVPTPVCAKIYII